MKRPLNSDEPARSEASQQYEALDTIPEPEFDDITHLASLICGTPFSAIALMDKGRLWFKSGVGVAAPEIACDISFCTHTLTENDLFIIPDTLADERFVDNPFVVTEPRIRFYAGVPLYTPAGQAIGTLSVLDVVPRKLDGGQQDALRRLARQTITLLEMRLGSTRRDAEILETSERCLIESERFLDSTLDALASHIAVLDETGQIIAANKAWRQFSEQNEGSLTSCGVGSNYIRACAEATDTCAQEAAAIADGIREVMEGRQKEFCLEYPCHSPTEERWFNACVTRFVGEGPVRVVVAHENITERKRAEKTLWQSEQQFRAVFHNALDAIIIIDNEGRFLEVNESACQIYGATRRQLLNMNVADFVEADRNHEQSIQVFRAAGQSAGDFQLSLQDGSEKYVEFAATTDFLPGRHLMALRDITERKRAGESLRKMEERLRIVTENARVGLVMVDAQRQYTYANAAYIEMLGLPFQDIVGLRVPDVLAQLYEEQVRPWLDRAFAGERVTYELHKNLSNEDHYYTVRYEPTEIDGQIALVVVVITDITGRKQAEESIRESASRVTGIVNAAMDAIITVDEDQRIVLFNPAAERMFGFTSTEILDQPIERLIPERFRHAHRGHVQNFAQSGMTSRKMGALGVLSGLHSNGKEFPIEASISQIFSGGQQLFTVILRDITERKQAEVALQRSYDELEEKVQERTAEIEKANESLRIEIIERKMALDGLREAAEILSSTQQMLQLVMNHIPQAIFWKDRNSIFLGGNYRLALDAGYDSPEELKGKSDFEMPWSEFAPDYLADDQSVMEQDKPKLNIEERLLKSTGDYKWLRTNKIPLHDSENKVVGLLCTYEDITEQKQAEEEIIAARREAEAANLAKSEFLSRMSHELRTPLNAILGFGQILDMDEIPPNRRKNIQHILKAGEHLLDLINEVLDISRIDAGTLSLSLEPVPIGLTIREVMDLVRPMALSGNINLLDEITTGNSWHVLADRQRLKQALLNLLSNAIKYNNGDGKVLIRAEEKADNILRLEVQDSGIGIRATDIKKLFTPFERLDAGQSRIEGTGIGLALTKRLIEAMGGSIGVHSTVGEGSTFWIELPLVDSPLQEVKDQNELLVPQMLFSTGGASKAVLYIEDNLANLQLVETLLEPRPDVRLLTAMQGSTGLDLAYEHHPDLILLDLHLPDLNGNEVLQRLQSNPVTGLIPVVIISADATPGQIERLMDAGATAYLTKPFNVRQLLRILEEKLYKD